MSDAMICVCVISVSKRYAAETRSSRVKIASSSLWYTSKKCIIIGELLDEIQFQSFSSTRERYSTCTVEVIHTTSLLLFLLGDDNATDTVIHNISDILCHRDSPLALIIVLVLIIIDEVQAESI